MQPLSDFHSLHASRPRVFDYGMETSLAFTDISRWT